VCYEDVLMLSSIRYNLLKSVHNNVIVVVKGNRHSRYAVIEVQGCRYTKLIDCYVYNNRYRYHKNAIINKDISPLVGLVLVFSVSSPMPPSSLPEQCDLFIVSQNPLQTMIQSLMIATYLCTLHSNNAPGRGGHESLWLSCPCMISCQPINQTITSTWTSCYSYESVVGIFKQFPRLPIPCRN